MTRSTDGGQTWWPPAHPWGDRRDEALSLRASRYSWRLPILVALLLVFLGTTFVRGVGRADPVAIVVPVVAGIALVVVVAKVLDGRIERRRRTGQVVEAPALLALRGTHGLERADATDGASWLAGVRALRERADGRRLRVVAALSRGDELVVALVTGDDDEGVSARDLVVVHRLPRPVETFHVRPRRHPETRVGAGVTDLYRVEPGPEILPGAIVAWLVTDRPHLRLEATGEWLVVHPPADHPPLDGDALAATADDLIAVAQHLADLTAT